MNIIAIAAAYAMKYARARSRSMVLAHLGIFHSRSVSGKVAVLGRWMITLLPVDLTKGVSTRLARAVAQSLASGPPPVSSGRCAPVRLSNQRGLVTQL